VVLKDRAALFVDGRYTLQAGEQADTSLFEIVHLVETPPDQWIERALTSADTLGFDPWLHTVRGASSHAPAPMPAPAAFPVVQIRSIRSGATALPAAWRVTLHDIRFAGEAAETKLSTIRPEIAKLKADALVISDPHVVAWTFNIRGADILHTPLPLSFAIIPRDGRPSLFIEGGKLSNDVRHRLEDLADVRTPDDFGVALSALGAAGKTVRLDQATASDALARIVRAAGGKIVKAPDPIALLKAVKNWLRSMARAQHPARRRGDRAILAWFDREAPSGTLTEIGAVEALETFRRETNLLKDVSFPTIAGAGPDGAIVHYRVTRKTDRTIAPGDLFLIDSGGQYQDGTTDITRTVTVGTPTAEMRPFTRVLKGHIAIARDLS
jgi:Xaa-Pro aminopeptidase